MGKTFERMCLGMSGLFIFCLIGFFGYVLSVSAMERVSGIGLEAIMSYIIYALLGIAGFVVLLMVIYTVGYGIDGWLKRVKQ